MIGVPKPKSRKSERRKIKRDERLWIRRVRQEVVERDGHGCRACRAHPATATTSGYLHMHEIVFRSATLGRPIQDRVNTRLSVLLCDSCHRDVHAYRLTIDMEDEERGADGELRFVRVVDV
jgi:hypothetical protein